MLKFLTRHKYFFLLLFMLFVSLCSYEKNLDGLPTFNVILILIELVLISFYVVVNSIRFFVPLKPVLVFFCSLIIIAFSVYFGTYISDLVIESNNQNWLFDIIIDGFLRFGYSFTIIISIILFTSLFIVLMRIFRSTNKNL